MQETFNKVPLYCQLASKIAEQIENGTYQEGDRIPSERELCNIYHVSRMTVRLAIDELVRKGKIEKSQGKGTYVSNKSIVQSLNNVYSLSKEMEKQGKISSTQIIKREIVPADYKVAKHLGIEEGEQVVFLERLRLAENVAVMVEKAWFPYHSFAFLLNIDFTKKGLYKTLEEEYNVKINRAIETFKATELNSHECNLLHCRKNQYGLLVKRTSYCNDKTICYSTIVSKGDIFEFTVQLGQ